MNETYGLVNREVDRLAATEGLATPAAAMWMIVVSAMAMASKLPESLRGALAQACLRWFSSPTLGEASLHQAAAHCWTYLETKHGNSTSIVDREDVAIRTLLCALVDDLPDMDELDMTIDFLVSMLDRFGGLQEVLFGAQ